MHLKKRLTLTISLLAPCILLAQKPILPDFHADPSAHVWDGQCWIYPSTDEAGSTTWWQMRRWECFSSTNLTDWINEGEILSLDDISWADEAAWAPDAVKWKGKYYFFFPADFQIGVAVSDAPSGPFKDALGKPLIEKDEGGIKSMDPCIFIDDHQTPYLYYGGWDTVGVVKLKGDLMTRDGEIMPLPLQYYHEGIWVHKRDDTYYFSYPRMIKRDGRDVQLLCYSTAPSPLGPFTYHGDFFDNDSRNSHHSIVEFNGQWYLFYHVQGPSPYERRVCMEHLQYNDDGTIQPVKMTKEGVATISEPVQ